MNLIETSKGIGSILQEFEERAHKAEYEVVFHQFVGGIVEALEECVGGVKMVSDGKVVLITAYRAQMLHKSVPKSAFGLTDVEEAISGATDTVDQVGGYAGEPLSDVEGLICALNG
eukprot:g36257.t1